MIVTTHNVFLAFLAFMGLPFIPPERYTFSRDSTKYHVGIRLLGFESTARYW